MIESTEQAIGILQNSDLSCVTHGWGRICPINKLECLGPIVGRGCCCTLIVKEE